MHGDHSLIPCCTCVCGCFDHIITKLQLAQPVSIQVPSSQTLPIVPGCQSTSLHEAHAHAARCCRAITARATRASAGGHAVGAVSSHAGQDPALAGAGDGAEVQHGDLNTYDGTVSRASHSLKSSLTLGLLRPNSIREM
jgi:hypothetical protein